MRSPTAILVRDELIGFARSRVMLVLWVALPILATGGYFLLAGVSLGGQSGMAPMTATTFMSFLMSSLAGTVAALMVAVDIVSERQRKVFDLLVIRPVRPEVIIWAKILAVFACVDVACVLSLLIGVVIDGVRGQPISPSLVRDLASLTSVIALSAATGAFFGVLSRTILVAVILVLYVGQNLAVVPMLPMYLGVLPNQFWLIMVITAALIAIMVYLAGVVFRRAEL